MDRLSYCFSSFFRNFLGYFFHTFIKQKRCVRSFFFYFFSFFYNRKIFKFEKNDPTLFFLQRLRDEAHRFAINAHRTKRQKGIRKSLLDQVNGIGSIRKRALLNHFGSAKAVESASFDEIKSFALNRILKNIEGDLKDFGVKHNSWFKESKMFRADKDKTPLIYKALDSLQAKKQLYEKDGDHWFRSPNFG